MKNLIKEIEGLKLKTHPEETEYRFGFRDGNNACVVSVKNILNKHNLITAPKQVKLSEVVSRLQTCFGHKLYIEENVFGKKSIGFDYFDEVISETWFEYVVSFEENLKIGDICVANNDKFKWLYTLWIAGTEIVDDLEE